MFLPKTALTPDELKSAIVSNPLIVKPNTTVIQAICQMSGLRSLCPASRETESEAESLHLEARSSCVLIVEDNKLLGILTERDVVRLSAQKRSLDKLVISDVMADPVITLKESAFTDILLPLNLLQQYQVRHLPILDDQNLVIGLVTHETLRLTFRPVDLLRLRLVAEVMTSKVICAAPFISMLGIAQLMADHRISSVVIVQDQAGNQEEILQIPLGIVTERDLVQFQALNLNIELYQAQDLMSKPMFSVTPTDSLLVVQQIMKQRLIRRLAVTGSQGELLGIVTQTSLLQVLNPFELYKLAEVLEQKILKLEQENIQILENRTEELEREVEARTSELKAMAEREHLVAKIASQIRLSLHLPDILETAVNEARSLLGCDHVTIWQYKADGSVFVIADSTITGNASYLGTQVQENYCFTAPKLDEYLNGKVRVISDIYTTQMSDCHRNLLENLQMRAKILVPIIYNQTVWGWVNAVESHAPRHWTPKEINFLEQLSTQLAIAIQQATAFQKLQTELAEKKRAEKTLKTLIAGTAAVTGEEFFPALVSYVAEALDVTYALVTELIDEKLHILAFCSHRVLQPFFSFDPILTPCERALKEGKFYCETLVQQLFPQDKYLQEMGADSYLGIALKDNHGNPIGNLCILDCKPLPESEPLESILTVFAARAAAELERKRALNQLHQLNHTLEARVAERTQKLEEREVQLCNLSDRLELALNSAKIGIWEWFIPDNLMIWDDRMYELYGITSSQPNISYKQWVRMLHPDDLNYTEVEIQKALEGIKDLEIEFRIVQPNGTIKFIKAYAIVEINPTGQPERMIGVNYDITDRKQAELDIHLVLEKQKQTNQKLANSNAELARATRLKDEFLANMSHELRTPLNAILGMSEGLQDEAFGGLINQQQRQALQTIERSGKHLLELIEDILDLAKIEAGQVELHLSQTSISQLCHSSITFVKQQAFQKSIKLEVKIPANLSDIVVDERRLRQVLINLLNNAVKFTPSGGRILMEVSHKRFSTEDEGIPDSLQIAVIDTGIGIAPENIGKLFQPFTQIDSALNRQYAGTGLGLSLVKRIVELHGGRVLVTSELGVGSRFTIDLPYGNIYSLYSDSIHPVIADQSAILMETPGRSPLILLAEDNEANIITISSYLTAKGFQVISAKNGQEAIELTKTRIPDLILMDIQMPQVDGLEAIKQIQGNPELAQIPIIALTALAMPGDRERCLKPGAKEFLTKPLKLKHLVSTIQKFLPT